ncbi:hypothetical protein HYE22_02890 [Mycoplasmopsis bovis]|nr:hypothetical protein [Mycoplasmopsis bovis]QQH24158.1 hypothetical protein HYE22_02890 [Mycoplasmopsis bovis]
MNKYKRYNLGMNYRINEWNDSLKKVKVSTWLIKRQNHNDEILDEFL